MRINEYFLSIQGEGTRAGELCAFFRLAGCSFGCFYCDTQYANGSDYKEYSVDELVKEISKYGVKLVEITGGEPLEQEETPLLAKKLLDAGFDVLIETNGIHDISVLPKEVIKIVDVKLPWANGTGEGCAAYEKLKQHFFMPNLAHLTENDEIKFVIDGETGYYWAKNFIEREKIPCKVIFSPCMDCMAKMWPQKLAEMIIADRLNVRFGFQFHKILWGNKRGV